MNPFWWVSNAGWVDHTLRKLTTTLNAKTTALRAALAAAGVTVPNAPRFTTGDRDMAHKQTVGDAGGQATIDALVAQIQATEGVLDSAAVYVQGVPGLIAAAVQQAQANGATASQLAPLTQLQADLAAKTKALTDAMAANQPPAPAHP